VVQLVFQLLDLFFQPFLDVLRHGAWNLFLVAEDWVGIESAVTNRTNMNSVVPPTGLQL